MPNLFSELKSWREKQAQKEGVELFRILPNAVLAEIVSALPKTREDLLSIKGIKEAKFRKYGREILALVAESEGSGKASIGNSSSDESRYTNSDLRKIGKKVCANENAGAFDSGIQNASIENQNSVPDTLSVSRFLDGVNLELSGMAARVRGEVSSIDERDRVVYFSLKDAEDGSTLPCLMFRSTYALSGVRLAIGDEVIVEGAPEIWKPMGKLSMKCGFLEYAGEGALKKAYDALLSKLTNEGLLAPERKREISAFPSRIALLTSRDGAAIGDFMTNIGRHGYQIDLYATSVEGARAVSELLSGLKYFQKHSDRYDVLVVVRGGGSLESLAAFNNETLVRVLADFPIPVIAGIGHEKDVTLATLVADAGVSTPTAASRLVRQSWEEGSERVLRAEHVLVSTYSSAIDRTMNMLSDSESFLKEIFQDMKERIRTIIERFSMKKELLVALFHSNTDVISNLANNLKKGKTSILSNASSILIHTESLLKQFDPNRVLNLGYSLVRLSEGRILRKSTDAKVGDRLDIRLAKGRIEAEVNSVFNGS